MSNLTYLNEASVLWNLKSRYQSKLIYVSFCIFSVKCFKSYFHKKVFILIHLILFVLSFFRHIRASSVLQSTLTSVIQFIRQQQQKFTLENVEMKFHHIFLQFQIRLTGICYQVSIAEIDIEGIA